MNQSVAELFEQYIERCDVSEGTLGVKRRAFRYFDRWFPGITPDRLTFEIVEDFQVLLKKGRSARTVNTYVRTLNPFFRWLVRMGWVGRNPMNLLTDLRVEVKKKTTFTPEELAVIVRVSDLRWRVILGLGLLGMRRGEVLNLTVRDVFMSEGYLMVASKKKTETTWPWTIKNNCERIVPLPESIQIHNQTLDLVDDLVVLMERLPANQPYICPRPSDYFRNIDRQKAGVLAYHHKAMPWGNFSRDFHNLQLRAGIGSPRRYHELRAAFATAMIRQRGLSEARYLMGHASVKTTDEYNRYEEMKVVAGARSNLRNCYTTLEL